jgi:hypothetical protein
MIGDGIRVVDSIATTLAQRFGVLVNAEEPQYQFPEDWQDIRDADPDWSAEHPKLHYLVPKRRRMETHFSILSDGSIMRGARLRISLGNRRVYTTFAIALKTLR